MNNIRDNRNYGNIHVGNGSSSSNVIDIDLDDGGIDWSAVDLPDASSSSSKPAHSHGHGNGNGHGHGHGHGQIQNNGQDDDNDVIIVDQYNPQNLPQHQHPYQNNDGNSNIMNHPHDQNGTSSTHSRGVISAASTTTANTAQNNNIHNPNMNPTLNQLQEKIKSLQSLLAAKDEELFNLESTMATVEAEAAFSVQTQKKQSEEEKRTSQDHIRSLQKEIERKDGVIGRMRVNMNMNANVNSGNKRPRSFDTNGTGLVDGNRIKRHLEPAQSPMMNEGAVAGNHHDFPSPRIPASIPTVHASSGTKTGTGTDAGTTPPLHNDPSSITSIGYTVQHRDERIGDGDIDAGKGNARDDDEVMFEPQSDVAHQNDGNGARSQHENDAPDNLNLSQQFDNVKGSSRTTVSVSSLEKSASLLASKRHEEIQNLLTYFIQCCDEKNFLKSVSPPPGDTSSFATVNKKDTNAGVDNLKKSDEGNHGNHERNNLNVGDPEEVTEIRQMLFQLLRAHICNDANRESDCSPSVATTAFSKLPSSTRNVNIIGIDSIVKELVTILVSMTENKFKNCNKTHGNERQREPMITDVECQSSNLNLSNELSGMYVAIELCSMNEKARSSMRSFLGSRPLESDRESIEESHNDSIRTINVRGIPTNYKNIINEKYIRYKMGREHEPFIDRKECELISASFQKKLLTWALGPSQYDFSSPLQRSYGQSLQRMSLKLLLAILKDAPRHDLMGLYQAIILHRLERSEDERRPGDIDIISILERSSMNRLLGLGRRYYCLIENGDDTSEFFHAVGGSDTLHTGLIETKTATIQLITQLARCPSVNKEIHDPTHMSLSKYRDGVSYARRIFAATLDDIQGVILPFMSEKDVFQKSSTLSMLLYFGSSIIRLLTLLTGSPEGLVLAKTLLIVDGKCADRDKNLGASCIGIIADVLEHSTRLLLECSGGHSNDRDEKNASKMWHSLRDLVQCSISFFFAIRGQCYADESTQKGNSHFSSIISDAERACSIISSCKTILCFPSEEASVGFRKITVDKYERLRARVMMQSLTLK